MKMSEEMEVATKYQSHLPALLACIAVTHGTVLEVGVGHFSTPQLHALCGALNRKLISMEPDKQWLEEFRGRYETENHVFTSELPTEPLSVALIDHSPGGENRAVAFKALMEMTDFVVVHDFHADNQDAIRPILAGMSYFVCMDYLPPTLVASKHFTIPSVL